MEEQNRRNFLKHAASVLGVAGLAGMTVGEVRGTAAAKTVTVEPVGNEMKYATTEITAEAGSELTIVMNNTATIPPMQHNVVVLQNQEGVKKTVGTAAMQAKDNDFIPPEHSDVIIAHTPMVKPGESGEVTFTVPEAGEYPYICTYPGHWMSMQGTLIVEG